jgi:hypothetical protein
MRTRRRPWSRRIRLAVRVIAIAGLTLFLTSNQAKALKLLAPGHFGMEAIGPGIYVNEEMSPAQRREMLRVAAESKRKLGRFYGGVTSVPLLVFCSTEERFQALGGGKQRGMTVGKYAAIFSPRGLTTPIVTHEWSHAELYARLGGYWKSRRVPQWFNEGLAVTVSEEPSHSEEVYEQARAEGIPIPPLARLSSLGQWNSAARSFGNPALNPHHLHVIYAVAGHEVRAWSRAAGSTGLRAFIARIRSGTDFAAAYAVARPATPEPASGP